MQSDRTKDHVRKPRRICVEYIGILDEYRASFSDNDGEGPYGTGPTELRAIEELYFEAQEEEQCAADCRCCKEEAGLLGMRGVPATSEMQP